MATSGLRHVGWWLAWHARAHPGEASRPLDLGVPQSDGAAVDENVA
jgi:hypothetical protein